MRRAKSKTNMLLNLLSQSTPGGNRYETQSTPCLLYPNPFHQTTACKKTHKDLEESWPNITDPTLKTWVTIAIILVHVYLNEEQYSTQDNMSILKLQLVQKHIETVYAISLSPVYSQNPLGKMFLGLLINCPILHIANSTFPPITMHKIGQYDKNNWTGYTHSFLVVTLWPNSKLIMFKYQQNVNKNISISRINYKFQHFKEI